MRSINNFILKIEKPLRETLKYGSLELYTPETVNQHNEWDYMNNFGEVVSIPEARDVECEIGDTVYVHHNVVINSKNTLNAENYQSNQYLLNENESLFCVPFEEVGRNNLCYVRVDKNGDLHCLGDVLLCEPFEHKKEFERESGIVVNEDYDKRGLYLTCKIAYTNKTSKVKGIEEGTIVTLADSSDYEIAINGKTYWRIFDNDIQHYEDDYTRPYGNDVCIQLDEVRNETSNGIILNNQKGLRSEFATVLGVGDITENLKNGDRIFLEDLSRMELIDSEDRIFYTKIDNILAVID
jgi:co-chaperonin GroES (HSP10)